MPSHFSAMTEGGKTAVAVVDDSLVVDDSVVTEFGSIDNELVHALSIARLATKLKLTNFINITFTLHWAVYLTVWLLGDAQI
jgi:hypothetical protein